MIANNALIREAKEKKEKWEKTERLDKEGRETNTVKKALHRKQMQEELWRFIQQIQAKNYSSETIDHYQRDLKCFLDFLQTETELHSLRGICPETLNAYQIYLRQKKNLKIPGKGLCIRSQFNMLCCLKKFLGWLEKENLLLKGVSEAIELPKLPHELPKGIMSSAEVKKLFCAPNLSTPIGYRNRAIMELLYSSGLRVGELCRIQTKDIDSLNGEIRIMGKGRRERKIPVGKIACQYLREYLLKVRPKLKSPESGDFLFVSKSGRPLRRKEIDDFFRSYREKAGITKQVTPHSLRHQSATELLRNGADIRHIQKFLGHANLNTTAIYAQVCIDDLKKIHQKCHSRERQKEEAQEFKIE